MLNFTLGVDWVAIFAAAVVAMIIGAAWYGVFAKPWMELNKFTEKDLVGEDGKQNPLPYVVAFMEALVFGFLFANLVDLLAINEMVQALELAGWTWIGFILLPQMTVGLYSNKPVMLTLLDTGKDALVLISTVLFVFYL